MICLNSGGNLVRSQVEERGALTLTPSKVGPGQQNPAFSSKFSSHSLQSFSPRSGRVNKREFEPPFPGRKKVRGVQHRRESSRTEPSLHLGRRSQRKKECCLRRPNAWTKNPREIANPTLRRAWPRDLPGAAICVQDVDVQCVLQFTLIHAAGCALHRHTSRVIHRLELSVTAEAATISFQPPEGRGSRRETNSHP